MRLLRMTLAGNQVSLLAVIAALQPSYAFTVKRLRTGTFLLRGSRSRSHDGSASSSSIAGSSSFQSRLHATSTSSSGSETTTSALLSVADCLQLYSEKEQKIQFVDATWFHKGNRNGREEFEAGPRIPGSVYFDMDDISASSKPAYGDLTASSLAHMLPTPDLFAATMDAFGIEQDDTRVIIYGRPGTLFLPRVWFTFFIMGHKAPISIMQGSLDEWIAQGGPVEKGPVASLRASDYFHPSATNNNSCSYQPTPWTNEIVVDLADMEQASQLATDGGATIVDARGSSFQRTGGMPGATNVPYSTLAVSEDATVFKPTKELQALFEQAGAVPDDESTPIYCTCGTGVSACSLFLALRECGRTENVFLYDGSWEEWSRQRKHEQ